MFPHKGGGVSPVPKTPNCKMLVLLSGGQDSTTCLYWARATGAEVHAISFDYGQRHKIELDAAKVIAHLGGVKSHTIVPMGPLLDANTSPLTNPDYQVEHYESWDKLPGGLEKTFVPGRNILFLALAGALAYSLDCDTLVIGVSQEDYGGYPDCRTDFIIAMSQALKQGLDRPMLRIISPLLHADKQQTVEWAHNQPNSYNPGQIMDALSHSHTCYEGKRPPCGKCHSCLLRAKGFELAGVPDPIHRVIPMREHAQFIRHSVVVTREGVDDPPKEPASNAAPAEKVQYVDGQGQPLRSAPSHDTAMLRGMGVQVDNPNIVTDEDGRRFIEPDVQNALKRGTL